MRNSKINLSRFGLGLMALPCLSIHAATPIVATYFDVLGMPYGGCGIPQDLLETQNFVAS